MSEAIFDQEEEMEQERPHFVVTDDQKAEWALEKIREKKAELEMWKAHYADLFAQIEKTINSDITHFENLLEAYFRSQMDAGFVKYAKKSASYKLPTGKLVLKEQEPEFEHNDDDLVPWLEQNAPEFVKVKKTADWSALKKTLVIDGTRMITEDAEVVPGVTVTPRGDIFKVEVK